MLAIGFSGRYVFSRPSDLELTTIANDRKKAPPLSLSNYFDGIKNGTILSKTKTTSIFR
jgi:hypothetical protein